MPSDTLTKLLFGNSAAVARTADYQQVTPTGLPAQEWAPPGLLNAKNALKVPVNEIAAFQDKKLQKERGRPAMEKLNRAADRRKPIEALEKQIAEAAAALWFSVRW